MEDMKTCVITGAAGGIGRETVELFLADDYRVVACGHTEPKLRDLARTYDDAPLVPMVMDVTNRHQVYEDFASLGGIDVLVAGAGVCRQARLDESESDEVWDHLIDVNLNGVYNCMRGASEWMREGGAMVAVSSGLGKNGRPGYEAYTASKHGVLGLVKCVAPELADRDIRVNAVCPGWVDTDMARRDIEESARRAGQSPEDFFEASVQDIPMERMVQPEEVAELIRFLASDAASGITGQSYNVACGEYTN